MSRTPLVSVQEACKILRISNCTILDYVDLGILPEPWRNGDILLGWLPYEIDAVDEWLPTAKECRELLNRAPYLGEE
ncbi:helix-turn-helix domain-containing protein [Desulfovibrio sp. OttesenSCG-928-C14]|nr:helix-turn-helix domain-containing protein [Desulfovibrio sp. OttesenSCG-928-C14]